MGVRQLAAGALWIAYVVTGLAVARFAADQQRPLDEPHGALANEWLESEDLDDVGTARETSHAAVNESIR